MGPTKEELSLVMQKPRWEIVEDLLTRLIQALEGNLKIACDLEELGQHDAPPEEIVEDVLTRISRARARREMVEGRMTRFSEVMKKNAKIACDIQALGQHEAPAEEIVEDLLTRISEALEENANMTCDYQPLGKHDAPPRGEAPAKNRSEENIKPDRAASRLTTDSRVYLVASVTIPINQGCRLAMVAIGSKNGVLQFWSRCAQGLGQAAQVLRNSYFERLHPFLATWAIPLHRYSVACGTHLDVWRRLDSAQCAIFHLFDLSQLPTPQAKAPRKQSTYPNIYNLKEPRTVPSIQKELQEVAMFFTAVDFILIEGSGDHNRGYESLD
ncbi:hypothetical protein R1sor_021505 [Riccia sorocarpa]|uniref:Uncharacterized protein n=1 Tax=Riccia sorocarpa TaxID=122646 RepID=A0ABD3GLG8_9MARC